MEARDGLSLQSVAEIRLFNERDQRRLIRGWGRLDAVEKLAETRRLVDAGLLHPRDVARGRNKVLREGARKLIRCLKDGTAYKVTHVELGSSAAATTEDMVACQAQVDAAAGKPRIAITELGESGYKTLNTSSFIESGEYVGANLREACLFDAATDGTAYNRVLFSVPLTPKLSTDTAVCNITHDLVN